MIQGPIYLLKILQVFEVGVVVALNKNKHGARERNIY
jgi:hypothetical protein